VASRGPTARGGRGPAGCRVGHYCAGAALASVSSFLSSPLAFISIMMSQPPTNSPLMYSCGMVGQLLQDGVRHGTGAGSGGLGAYENFLTPSRISTSSKTLKAP
jgi:hypothetical protein